MALSFEGFDDLTAMISDRSRKISLDGLTNDSD